MLHKEYKHIVSNGDTAILMIHGIVGTPDHFDMLIPLVPDSVSVYNILLDGHGKDVKDFSRTSMKKWEKQVDNTVSELLKTHTKVYIAAHSMGTLFAIEQAVCRNEVKGLFLLAVPIKIGPTLRMFSNAFKVYRGNIHENDPYGTAAKAACSINPSKNLFHYVGWIPRYFELFHKIHQTRKLLPYLQTPAVAIQSRLDEMVSKYADRYLKAHSTITVYTLEDSYHYLYESEDQRFIETQFSKFIQTIKGGKR